MTEHTTRAAELQELIDDLEGEVMLAGFHGYTVTKTVEQRLLALYKEQDETKSH